MARLFDNLENMTSRQLVELFSRQKDEIYAFNMKDFVRVRDSVHTSNMERRDRKYRNVLVFKKGIRKRFFVRRITCSTY